LFDVYASSAGSGSWICLLSLRAILYMLAGLNIYAGFLCRVCYPAILAGYTGCVCCLCWLCFVAMLAFLYFLAGSAC
jgi:hypothetical protein